MAEFKVIKAKIDVYPHSNADKLELIKIGNYQVVAEKGLYLPGETVAFAPEKSILPEILAEPFKKYLRGQDKNRVGLIRLRGEISMGVILPLKVIDPDDELPYDVDISEKLGIVKYEPPIPVHLAGDVKPLNTFFYALKHDCEQFGIYADEFKPGETVYVFEKLHGTQCVILKDKDDDFQISSKGLFAKNLGLKPSDSNTYWKACRESFLLDLLVHLYPNIPVQVFGEVIPVQKGFNYKIDSNHPTIKVFRLVIEGVEVAYNDVPEVLKAYWVPLIEQTSFNQNNLLRLGKKLKASKLDPNQIAEGIVVSPEFPRRALDDTPLYLKIISDRYAKVEDEDALA
jgi:RNA ligase (TIGR02306 family)